MTQGDKEMDKTEAEKREALEACNTIQFILANSISDDGDRRCLIANIELIRKSLSPPPVDASSKASLDDSDASGLLPEVSYFHLANGYPHNNEVKAAIAFWNAPTKDMTELGWKHLNVLLSAGRQYIKEGTRSPAIKELEAALAVYEKAEQEDVELLAEKGREIEALKAERDKLSGIGTRLLSQMRDMGLGTRERPWPGVAVELSEALTQEESEI